MSHMTDGQLDLFSCKKMLPWQHDSTGIILVPTTAACEIYIGYARSLSHTSFIGLFRLDNLVICFYQAPP